MPAAYDVEEPRASRDDDPSVREEVEIRWILQLLRDERAAQRRCQSKLAAALSSERIELPFGGLLQMAIDTLGRADRGCPTQNRAERGDRYHDPEHAKATKERTSPQGPPRHIAMFPP
jgi:hypothetical protein